MNRHGHAKTLVPAHPGNNNAIKAGVFSPTALAPRISELDAAIAERPPGEVVTDLLRRELAALAAHGEAMDRSLEEDGVRGRRGDPRTLINLRLRLNEKLRRTLVEYEAASGSNPVAHGEAPSSDGSPNEAREDEIPSPLPVTVAWLHSRPKIEAIAAFELDPESFLRAIVITADPLVTTRDRLRARRMLTRRRAERSPMCVCFATLKARDEIELRKWIDEYRESGAEVSKADAADAAAVRQLARGDGTLLHRNWRRYWEAVEAFNEVVRLGVARARGELTRARGEEDSEEGDPAVKPFWRIVLSPDETLLPHERLKAFAALEEMNVLPRCTCDQKKTIEAEAWGTYVIRMVAQKHYRAAAFIASYPETYLAVRDAVDAAIVADRIASEERAGASAEADVAKTAIEDPIASEEPTNASAEPENRVASDDRVSASANAEDANANDEPPRASAEADVADLKLETADDPIVPPLRKPHARFTEEEMAVSILRAWKDLGRSVIKGEVYKSWRSAKPKDERRSLPTLAAIERTFGGWEQALQFAATPPPAPADRAGSVTRRSSFSTAKSSAAAIAG
jgi:hypothetical protein